MSQRPPSNLRRALPAILFACFIYAILSAIVKKELSHLNVPGILFWRYAICILLFVPWMLYQRRGKSIDLKPTSFRLYGMRVAGSLASIYLYCEALKTLSISMASLLFNMLPLYVPFVAYLWRKVPINHNLWWGFGVSMLGVGFVLSPHQIQWNLEMLLALLSGLCGAFSVVSLRFTHFEEPAYRINFYFFLLAFAMTVPLTFLNIDKSWTALSTEDILPLFLIGLIGLLYQQSFSYALKNAPARFLAPFLYSSVIWGMLLDQWIWGTHLTFSMWVGVGLTILGNVLIYLLYPKKELTS